VLRVVFTVALAVAVLGVAGPAVDQAGVHHSDAAVDGAIERLVGAARDLAASNPALSPEADPARRTVTVTVPDGGFASAPVRNFSVGPPTENRSSSRSRIGPDATRFEWRVAGGAWHTRTVDGVRIRPAAAATTRVSGGEVRFALELVSVDGDRVVRLSHRPG